MADTLTLVERTAFLKSMRMLSSIPLEALAELAGRAREIHCEPGDVVFREGDPNRGTFFVVDGLLEQRRGRALLAVFRPGSAIGELWLEEGEPHESRLVALQSSHLLNIDREDVREGLLEYPEFGAALVDALWVRGLGVEATAAVTTSVFVMWTVYSLHDIFGIGVAAYVSQLLGAGERRRAGLAAYKGMRAAALLGLAGTALGLFGARSVYQLMNAGPGVTENGARYLAVVLGAAPIPMTALTCETIMRSAGDTRTPLLIDLCAVGLNALLDPILIYGWGPVPAM